MDEEKGKGRNRCRSIKGRQWSGALIWAAPRRATLREPLLRAGPHTAACKCRPAGASGHQLSLFLSYVSHHSAVHFPNAFCSAPAAQHARSRSGHSVKLGNQSPADWGSLLPWTAVPAVQLDFPALQLAVSPLLVLALHQQTDQYKARCKEAGHPQV